MSYMAISRIEKDACLCRHKPMKTNSVTKRNNCQLLKAFRMSLLKRHEINGNYYAVKKILGKIKRHALRSKGACHYG